MSRRPGFTLVELVVVILILGILAGVAAPKFFNTSGTARDNGLKQTLAIVRDGIELYQAKYGVLPRSTGTDGADFKTDLAEFVRGSFPVCPVGTMDAKVAVQTSGATTTHDATPATSWKYNSSTGAFICNSGDASSSGPVYSSF